MKGYFINAEEAKEMGLDKNPAFQKTIIVVTENDLTDENPNMVIDGSHMEEFQIWFYKKYYYEIINTLKTW